MHLHGNTLARYLAGSLDPSAVAAIDVHLANCLPCAHSLGQHGAVSGRWERRGLLQRLVRVDAPAQAGADAAERPSLAA
jgi:anti-sigma factor RsiW